MTYPLPYDFIVSGAVFQNISAANHHGELHGQQRGDRAEPGPQPGSVQRRGNMYSHRGSSTGRAADDVR